jgi:hypothetical protein
MDNGPRGGDWDWNWNREVVMETLLGNAVGAIPV